MPGAAADDGETEAVAAAGGWVVRLSEAVFAVSEWVGPVTGCTGFGVEPVRAADPDEAACGVAFDFAGSLAVAGLSGRTGFGVLAGLADRTGCAVVTGRDWLVGRAGADGCASGSAESP